MKCKYIHFTSNFKALVEDRQTLKIQSTSRTKQEKHFSLRKENWLSERKATSLQAQREHAGRCLVPANPTDAFISDPLSNLTLVT